MSEISRDIRGQRITNPRFKLWKTDTKSIVGGVLMAVCFTVTMQFTERIDTAVSGGVIYWFGETFVHVWFSAAVIWFGLLGGLLTALFNPIIAILTATSPLAPRFFLDNSLYVVAFALLTYRQFKTKGYIDFKAFIRMGVIGMLAVSMAYIGTWIFLFEFSIPTTLGLTILVLLTAIPGALMGFALNRAIGRSGILE